MYLSFFLNIYDFKITISVLKVSLSHDKNKYPIIYASFFIVNFIREYFLILKFEWSLNILVVY